MELKIRRVNKYLIADVIEGSVTLDLGYMNYKEAEEFLELLQNAVDTVQDILTDINPTKKGGDQ